MNQKKLYRAIERVASEKFNSENDLFDSVLSEIINNENFEISGGRVWKLVPEENAYTICLQKGNVATIDDDFRLKIEETPILDYITHERTILADETNEVLRAKGIFRYSASGFGRKIKTDEKRYYEYLLALNSSLIDENLRDTLNVVATVLTSKINERKLSVSRKNLIEDIDKAKQLQRSILPEHEYEFHNYNVFGVTIPAKDLGGDFYDYLQSGDEERLGIVVGDAASKGIAAAAEAMYISGAIRMASTFNIKISYLMKRINQLVNKIFSDDKFATMFYGEISNDNRGLFLYANAGHNPPMFVRKSSMEITYLMPTGPLIGPAPASKFETDSLNFRPGDVLVIFSDGIVEAANKDFDFYEEARLEEVIKRSIDKTPKEIVYAILDDVLKFSAENSQYQDDKTLVVIKRKDE